MAKKIEAQPPDVVLKNGLLVDGTGSVPRSANLLIRAGKIHRIADRPIRTTGVAIECGGMIVAPGFIDPSSHLDAIALPKTCDELKHPLVAQGITTAVGGNCGSSAAGFRRASSFLAQVRSTLPCEAPAPPWETVEELFDKLASSGACVNLALLAGHGSARASIRVLDASPLHPYESKELFWLLESAMDQGARGVSLGLQQAPGMFARPDELKEIALLVRRKGKLLVVHLRAYSSRAPGIPSRPFGEPQNLIALREALDLARATGVRLQISHLLFAGPRTWRTCEQALQAIDRAIGDGVDVRFDLIPRVRLEIPVSLLLPPGLIAGLPGSLEHSDSLGHLAKELRRLERGLGFTANDVTLSAAGSEELAEHEGASLAEVARMLRMRPAAALAEIARRSACRARVQLERCGTDKILDALARHPASLFSAGSPGSGSQGAFPRFLKLARDRRLASLEEIVRKMSGATAERFAIVDRGLLKENLAADIVVFDWEKVADDAPAKRAGSAPAGIAYVFINGRKIMSGGKRESPLTAGVPLR
jgi:N-acyl-D-aspartate/D-glutamate deacylase